MFEALPSLVKEFPSITYVVVGEGEDKESLQQIAKEKGLPVIFTGFIPEADLPAVYRACDVFVMPSDREGFGIVFIEALAVGKPVVAARNSGAEDIVSDMCLGSLVGADSVEELVQAIREQLSADAQGGERAAFRKSYVTEMFMEERFKETLRESFGT